MAVRTIIRIDEEKCTGCGLCVPDCAEGALQIVGGKARLVKEIYCDGLGACLGACPEGALTLVDREAEAFDELAVEEHLRRMEWEERLPCGCPGSAMRTVGGEELDPTDAPRATGDSIPSALRQWPVQLMLVPPAAPFLKGADLLLCADCVAFAMSDLHARFMAGRSVLVACPKLDDAAHYRSKLIEIFREAQPKSITVLRMEVPCCGGLAHLAEEAHKRAGANSPLDVHVVEIEGGGVRA
jgi:Pyruvate/2-oxoacid:ferredoxin oxidoreductase delta subunit